MLGIIASILGIVIAFDVVHHFIKQAHAKKKPAKAYWIAIAFGIGAAIAALILENLLPAKYNAAGTSMNAFVGNLLAGVIEEVLKFLPFAWFVYRKPYFKHYTDAVILFATVGFSFAILEDIGGFWGGSPALDIIRLLGICFHPATVALVSYFLMQANIKHLSFAKVTVALISMIVLHAIFDYTTNSNVGLLILLNIAMVPVITVGLFKVYGRAKRADMAKFRKSA